MFPLLCRKRSQLFSFLSCALIRAATPPRSLFISAEAISILFVQSHVELLLLGQDDTLLPFYWKYCYFLIILYHELLFRSTNNHPIIGIISITNHKSWRFLCSIANFGKSCYSKRQYFRARWQWNLIWLTVFTIFITHWHILPLLIHVITLLDGIVFHYITNVELCTSAFLLIRLGTDQSIRNCYIFVVAIWNGLLNSYMKWKFIISLKTLPCFRPCIIISSRLLSKYKYVWVKHIYPLVILSTLEVWNHQGTAEPY